MTNMSQLSHLTHTYYIIESPTLGTLSDTEYEYPNKLVPRYSISGARTENAILFHNQEQAMGVVLKLRTAKARGHKNLMVVRTSDFRSLCDECQGWIDNSYGNPKGHADTCSVWRKWLATH
jgi:hypothetical protein